MNRIPSPVLLLTVVVIVWPALVYGFDRTITGVVLGADGQPLQNVQVTGNRHNAGGGYVETHTQTGADGRFRLERVGSVLNFRARGFQPVTVVATSDADMTISLVADLNSSRLSECGTVPRGYRFIGEGFRLSVPRGTKTTRRVGDDTWENFIYFPGDKNTYLAIWEGPGNYEGDPLFHGFVREEWILNSQAFSQRTASLGSKIVAMDIMGQSRNGSHWRWISTESAVIYYQRADDKAAAFFDRILETACVPAIR